MLLIRVLFVKDLAAHQELNQGHARGAMALEWKPSAMVIQR